MWYRESLLLSSNLFLFLTVNFGYLIYDFLSFLLPFLAYGKKCFLLHTFSPLTLCKTFVRQLGTSFYLEWSLRRNSNFSVCAEWLYRSEESSAAGLSENDVRFLSDSWVFSHLLRRRVTWLLWHSYLVNLKKAAN